jgi:Predicted nucleic acid-binding protein, contains PIN domain
LNLLECTSSDKIFIDSNIFLDYIIPHPAFYIVASDFLKRVEIEEIHAITTPAVLAEVSHILLLETGAVILKNHNRNIVMNKIESDSHFSNLCRDAVDKFNEFISKLDGLKLIPVMPEDYFRASDLARAYNLMSFDALHLSAMRRAQVRNIATRDRDFDRVDGIAVWSP